MSATAQFIESLARLKAGELGLLRTHSGQGLDETVAGFDLFAGVWWPLRRKSERAPRREVAWLIAKLYASCPITHSSGEPLACQLCRSEPSERRAQERFRQKFDAMLILPVNRIEPSLRWALDRVASGDRTVDWVALTDDLSFWERDTTRLRWAEQYLANDERVQAC